MKWLLDWLENWWAWLVGFLSIGLVVFIKFKSIVESVKNLLATIRRFEELSEKINLGLELRSCHEDLIPKNKENLELKQENKRLMGQLEISKRVVFDGYILRCDNEPICSRCFDISSSTDRKIIRLLRADPERDGEFRCPECRNIFYSKEGCLQTIQMRNRLRSLSWRDW